MHLQELLNFLNTKRAISRRYSSDFCPKDPTEYSRVLQLLYSLSPSIRNLKKTKQIFEEYDARLYHMVPFYDPGQRPPKLRYRFGPGYAYAFFTLAIGFLSDRNLFIATSRV
jgi:hypothetical protein